MIHSFYFKSLFQLCFLLLLHSLVFAQEPPDTNNVVDPAYLEAFDYRMVGPFRGGRVTAVAGVGGRRPTLYMGATGGGVWKSTNNGLSYKNVSDAYFDVGSIGAISVAASDSNVVYVGTGSACIRSNVSTGRGVYKSLDAGESWMFSGLPEAGQIGSIAVHPEDPDLVYVAALGHPFGPNPERGVYRSFDGGDSWEQVLSVSDSTGAVSISMNPGDPEEIYAALWRAERKPWTIISGGGQSGLYKTSDSGDTWFELTEGLPDSLVGKIDVSVSPADPNRVYVLVEAPDGAGGLYRSDDAGVSFEHINAQKSLIYRPFYYTHVHADPNDADVVYVSNENFFVSTDAGQNFSRINTPHGDHHALWINPDDSNFLFQGNDGGATASLDRGRTWSSLYNQPTAEMYHVVVDDRIPYRLYGEQQDNTTISVPSLPPAASTLHPIQHWESVAGCETGPIAVHPTDPDIIYGGCKGRFSRFNRRTGQEQQFWVYPYFNYGHAASEMPYRFQRTSPIEISPHNPSVIYTTSQYVHKTTNEGLNWTIISPDLTAFEPDKQGYSGEPITRDITGEEIYSAIYQFRESPLEEGVLWAGSNDGLIHVSRDGGDSWLNVTPDSLLPGGRVQTIDPSPHRRGSAFIAVYRYMLDDWKPYIYKTDDYGASWTLLTSGSNGIPADHPTRVVREDPNRAGLLFAGTEFGMFISFDHGAHWQSFQLDLPATPVTDIRIHDKDLILSTMGRSFWILDDLSPLYQFDENPIASHRIFSPAPLDRIRWRTAPRTFDGAEPEYPPFGGLFYYYLQEAPESELYLDILDDTGEIIRSFNSTVEPSSGEEDAPLTMQHFYEAPATESILSDDPGMHRFAWDLRHAGPGVLKPGGYQEDGPLVPPGSYQVRLRVDDWEETVSFELRMDPRIEADGVTVADIEAQVLLSLRIRDAITELRHAVGQIRRLTATLDERSEILSASEAVAQLAGELHDALSRLENQLIQTQEGKIGAQLQPKLMRQLTYLYSMLDVADQKPGEDAYQRIEDIEIELENHLKTLESLLNERIQALNADLESLGQQPVTWSDE